jgi:hypothetical protein
MSSNTARALLFCGAITLVGFHAAPAQTITPGYVPQVAVGSRVRISAPHMDGPRELAHSGDWQIGTVQAMDTSSVTLRLDSDGSVVSFPLSILRGMEVSRGDIHPRLALQRDAATGAVIGMAAGGVVAVVGALTHDFHVADCEPDCSAGGILRPTTGHAAILVGGGAVVGAFVGALLGGTTKRERWEKVLGVGITANGAAVSIRLRGD